MNTKITTIAATVFAASMFAGVANAAENPFGMTQLDRGYVAMSDDEGKCGEKKKDGKCGEGKCGDKKKDAKCGGDKKCGGK